MNASQEKLIERIRKLLRLGKGSSHAAEAAASMAKAYELANAAGIAIEGVDLDKEPLKIVHEFGGVARRSHSRLRCHGVLKRHFSVRVVGDSGRGALYIGPAVNIAIARHIEVYLVRACSSAWMDHAALCRIRTPKRDSARRRVYECSFYSGIEHVLSQKPIRNDREEVERAIELYSKENFDIKSAPMKSAPSRIHATDYFGGLRAGKNTNLSRPVEGAAESAAIGSGARLSLSS